jgi:transposase-like protein
MGTKKVILQSKRLFSEEFKKSCVKEYESGHYTVSELGRLYNIRVNMIYRWIYKYSVYNKKKVRIVEMEESSTKKVKDLQDRIKELERIVGQKQLNIDYLEKMIELAKEHFDIDIKKNFNTPQSNGSATTGKKYY